MKLISFRLLGSVLVRQGVPGVVAPQGEEWAQENTLEQTPSASRHDPGGEGLPRGLRLGDAESRALSRKKCFLLCDSSLCGSVFGLFARLGPSVFLRPNPTADQIPARRRNPSRVNPRPRADSANRPNIRYLAMLAKCPWGGPQWPPCPPKANFLFFF